MLFQHLSQVAGSYRTDMRIKKVTQNFYREIHLKGLVQEWIQGNSLYLNFFKSMRFYQVDFI